MIKLFFLVGCTILLITSYVFAETKYPEDYNAFKCGYVDLLEEKHFFKIHSCDREHTNCLIDYEFEKNINASALKWGGGKRLSFFYNISNEDIIEIVSLYPDTQEILVEEKFIMLKNVHLWGEPILNDNKNWTNRSLEQIGYCVGIKD